MNQRREFFRVTALQAKEHLAEFAGELLEFRDVPEALEYRQSIADVKKITDAGEHIAADRR